MKSVKPMDPGGLLCTSIVVKVVPGQKGGNDVQLPAGGWTDVDWVKPKVPGVWCADAGRGFSRCALPSCLQEGCSSAVKNEL